MNDTHHDIANICAYLGDVNGPVATIADLWPDDVTEPAPPTTATITYEQVREMLQAKNAAYGDSALSPVRVFSQASAVEQLLVRIDDKLSRMRRGHAAGEEIEKDLIGYLVLLHIAVRRAAP